MFDPTKGLHIPYPILVTSFHQFSLWFISYLFIRVRQLKEEHSQVKNTDGSINWKFYFKYIIPTAAATAGDIGFGNVSFEFVPLTVYTIIKSSSIAFVLLFGCIFRLERFHWKLVVIVVVMFVGVVVMVYDPSGNQKNDSNSKIIFGSFLVLASSCLSGLRWVYTQVILRKELIKYDRVASTVEDTSIEEQIINPKEKPHPIHTIYRLAPVMGIILFLTALIIERPFPGLFDLRVFRFLKTVDGNEILYISFESVSRGIILLIFPGLEVFVMTLCEFGILQIAKVLTLSIAGIVKEVLTIVFGVLILNEKISGLHSWVGMVIILLDVSYYNYFRYTENNLKSEVEPVSSEIGLQERISFAMNRNIEDKLEALIEYSFSTDPIMQDFELHVLTNDITEDKTQLK